MRIQTITVRRNMRIQALTAVVIALLELTCGLRVLSTNKDRVLPEKYGFVEIVNSSLKHYAQFSLCGRFQTYQFISYPDTQTVTETICISS